MALTSKIDHYLAVASLKTNTKPLYQAAAHHMVKQMIANSPQARLDLKPNSRARKRAARHLARYASHMAHALKTHAHPADYGCAVNCARKVLNKEDLDLGEIKGALRAYHTANGKSKHVYGARVVIGAFNPTHQVESGLVTSGIADTANTVVNHAAGIAKSAGSAIAQGAGKAAGAIGDAAKSAGSAVVNNAGSIAEKAVGLAKQYPVAGVAAGAAALAGAGYAAHKIAQHYANKPAAPKPPVTPTAPKPPVAAKPATPPKPPTPPKVPKAPAPPKPHTDNGPQHVNKAHASFNTDVDNPGDHAALKLFHEKLADQVLHMPLGTMLLSRHAYVL
jgi:hypothetical protein